ncbi:unnamed protein product [Cyclocybe aegerita]|uniref:Uncharacterized protein n=1 Tax=Cyclocybe aegerita TaxID=1973307 RepID=A0A8S0XWQ1_CYCAE|nr:unnamed protein product [Cyclocybe aegerita]
MSTTSTISHHHDAYFPPELLYAVCAHVYASCLLPEKPSLDPLMTNPDGLVPTGHPTSYPAGYTPEPVTRRTLANLCLVNHAWYGAAKPWLWRKLEVRLPRTWLSLVEEIAWNYEDEPVDAVMGKTIKAATEAAMHSTTAIKSEELRLVLDDLDGPDTSISPELLSPVPTRDPSPRRLRPKSKSPARWKIVRSISDAIQDVISRGHPGMYVPVPKDPRPGRFVRHLDFNHFRTIGMRRSVEEGVNSRFVTGDRVEAVLKEMPNLTAFGATEYMDGALILPVLNELFLRGAPSGGRGRPTRGRALMDTNDIEEEDRERRRDCKDLEAVDLTGCVSAVFVNAFTEFVNTHLLPPPSESDSGSDDEDGGRRSRRSDRYALLEPLLFPGLQRLGLRGVKSILPRVLGPFVLAFPHLTHLDLSGTRLTPEILDSLGQSPTLRLKSLALARCIKLSSESIRRFLVDSPVTSELTELNLYGDMTYQSPIVANDLRDIVSMAPCFLSGNLVYLDLSSAPLDRSILEKVKPQPSLRSLGLSHILHLELKAVTEFVRDKAPNVEILALVNTSPQLDCGIRLPVADVRSATRQSTLALQSQVIRPLCLPQFSFSVTAPTAPKPPATRLRVIELSTAMLGGLGAGVDSWKIIRSKGGRGWYVDTASGWVAQPCSGQGSTLRRDLPPNHPLRIEMCKLSEANGNVSSGVGWHARKMEILHGHGMLGREDGLYGAVSFAYQG